MKLDETLDRRKAFVIILGLLIVLIILGILIGKALFWEKYDTRTSLEKDLERFQTEVSLNPERVTARLNLGWTYYKLGDIVEAEEQYKEALKLEPENISANYNLATVLLAKGEFEQAEQYFLKVTEMDDKHLLAFFGLGETLRLSKRFEEAEQVLLKALELEGKAADVLCELALVYEEWGKKEEAVNYFKKAVNLLPNYQDARAGLERLGEGNYQPGSPRHNGGNANEN